MKRLVSCAASIAVWMVGIACVSLLLAVGLGPRTGHYRTLTVLSGSMTPRIPVGALVVVTPERPDQLRVGQSSPTRYRSTTIASSATESSRSSRGGDRRCSRPKATPTTPPTLAGPGQRRHPLAGPLCVPHVGRIIQWLRRPLVHTVTVLVFPPCSPWPGSCVSGGATAPRRPYSDMKLEARARPRAFGPSKRRLLVMTLVLSMGAVQRQVPRPASRRPPRLRRSSGHTAVGTHAELRQPGRIAGHSQLDGSRRHQPGGRLRLWLPGRRYEVRRGPSSGSYTSTRATPPFGNDDVSRNTRGRRLLLRGPQHQIPVERRQFQRAATYTPLLSPPADEAQCGRCKECRS